VRKDIRLTSLRDAVQAQPEKGRTRDRDRDRKTQGRNAREDAGNEDTREGGREQQRQGTRDGREQNVQQRQRDNEGNNGAMVFGSLARQISTLEWAQELDRQYAEIQNTAYLEMLPGRKFWQHRKRSTSAAVSRTPLHEL